MKWYYPIKVTPNGKTVWGVGYKNREGAIKQANKWVKSMPPGYRVFIKIIPECYPPNGAEEGYVDPVK